MSGSDSWVSTSRPHSRRPAAVFSLEPFASVLPQPSDEYRQTGVRPSSRSECRPNDNIPVDQVRYRIESVKQQALTPVEQARQLHHTSLDEDRPYAGVLTPNPTRCRRRPTATRRLPSDPSPAAPGDTAPTHRSGRIRSKATRGLGCHLDTADTAAALERLPESDRQEFNQVRFQPQRAEASRIRDLSHPF
jgi:hypothetical protein